MPDRLAGKPTGYGLLVRLLPGLALLCTYQRGWLRPDLIAGATVGAMLVPQCMAYAELARMPPEYGFYAVIAPLVLYALVGRAGTWASDRSPGRRSSRRLGWGRSPPVTVAGIWR